MKLIEKITDGIGMFAPIVILIFACVSYLRYPENKRPYPEQFRKEMKQEVEKNHSYSASEYLNLYRD
jgi:hypothetical protein